MPSQPKSPRAGRIVRKTLADGTVKEYHYGAWKPRRRVRYAADSMDALLAAFRRSPEYASRAPSTQAQYRTYLRVWDRMGHVRAADVTRRAVLTLRDGVAAGSGPGAANAFARITGALFAWAVDRGWREHSPAARIRALPGGHLIAWAEAQALRAEQELPPHLARVVTLGRFTGQRRTDLAGLTWAAYDGTALRLRQGKAGRSAPLMVIPCHPTLRAALDAWKAARGDAVTILTNGWGRPWTGTTLSAAMKRGMEKLDMPGLNVHGLRKLAATALAEAGCTPSEIAAITGHRTLAMVELYTRSVDQQRMAGAAIAKLQPAQPRAKGLK
jgi:integrase